MPPSSPPASTSAATTSTPTKRSRRPSFLLSRPTPPPAPSPTPAASSAAPPAPLVVAPMKMSEMREKERERERHKLARGLLVKKDGKGKGVKKVVLVEDVFSGGTKKGGEGKGVQWVGAKGEKRVEVGELVVVLTPPEEACLPSSTIFPCASPPPPKPPHPFNTRPRHHPPPPRRPTILPQPAVTVVVHPPPPTPPKVVIHPATNSPVKPPPAPASPPTAVSSPVSTDESPKTMASSVMSSPDVPFEFDDGSSTRTTSTVSPPSIRSAEVMDSMDVPADVGDEEGEVEEMMPIDGSPPRRPESPTPTKHHHSHSHSMMKHAAKPSHSSISSEDSCASEEGVVMRGFVVTPQSPIAIRTKSIPSAAMEAGRQVSSPSSYTSPPDTPTTPAGEETAVPPANAVSSSSSVAIPAVPSAAALPAIVRAASAPPVLVNAATPAPPSSPTKSKAKAKAKDAAVAAASPTKPKSATTPMARRPSLGGRISSDVSDAIRGFARLFPNPPPLPTSPVLASHSAKTPDSPTKRRLPFQASASLRERESSGGSFFATRALPENPPLEFDSGLGRPRPKSFVPPSASEEAVEVAAAEEMKKEKEKERTLQSKRSTKSFKRFFLPSSASTAVVPPLPVTPAVPTPPKPQDASTAKRSSHKPAAMIFVSPSAPTPAPPAADSKRRSRSMSTAAPSKKAATSSTPTEEGAKKDGGGGKTIEKRFSVASLSAAFSSSAAKKAAKKDKADKSSAATAVTPDVPEVPLAYRIQKSDLAAIVVPSPPRPTPSSSSASSSSSPSPMATSSPGSEETTELETAGGSIRESETVERELARECRARTGVVRESGSLGTIMTAGSDEPEDDGENAKLEHTRERRVSSATTVVGDGESHGEEVEGGEGMAPEMTRGPSTSSTASAATLSSSSSPSHSDTKAKHPAQSPALPSNPSFPLAHLPTHPSLHLSDIAQTHNPKSKAEWDSLAMQLKLRSLHFAPLGLDFEELMDGMEPAMEQVQEQLRGVAV